MYSTWRQDYNLTTYSFCIHNCTLIHIRLLFVVIVCALYCYIFWNLWTFIPRKRLYITIHHFFMTNFIFKLSLNRWLIYEIWMFMYIKHPESKTLLVWLCNHSTLVTNISIVSTKITVTMVITRFITVHARPYKTERIKCIKQNMYVLTNCSNIPYTEFHYKPTL
jgi:hypothetical protein